MAAKGKPSPPRKCLLETKNTNLELVDSNNNALLHHVVIGGIEFLKLLIKKVTKLY